MTKFDSSSIKLMKIHSISNFCLWELDDLDGIKNLPFYKGRFKQSLTILKEEIERGNDLIINKVFSKMEGSMDIVQQSIDMIHFIDNLFDIYIQIQEKLSDEEKVNIDTELKDVFKKYNLIQK